MKIAFVGKGGSGKTTLSSLFARHLAVQGLPVLAIDADINQHLALSLGMAPGEAAALPPLGVEMDRLKDYLRGDNPRLSSPGAMIKTTPPGHGSRLLKVIEVNPVYDYFRREVEGVSIMATGPFTEEDLGVKCYHSKTGAVELLLNHLIDGQNEYVVVDMTAGADSFASGMFTRFDVSFLVVEPTLKSLSVYEQYRRYGDEYGVLVKVIGNKVEDSEDEAFLRQRLGDNLVATFGRSAYVRRMERGSIEDISQLEPDNRAVLEGLRAVVDKVPKDWQKFYDQAVEFHRKNALSWANAAAGADLTSQIDPDFSLTRAIAALRP